MFAWSFSTHKEHTPAWYMIAVVVVLSLVIYGIVEGIYIMSVVSFLFAGVYILMENNSSPITQVEVTSAGIKVDATFYDYGSLAKYAIVYVGEQPLYLRLTPHKKLSTIVDVPLTEDVDSVELRAYLGSHLEEEKDVKFSNSDALIHVMRL